MIAGLCFAGIVVLLFGIFCVLALCKAAAVGDEMLRRGGE